MNGSLVNTYCIVFTLHKGNVEKTYEISLTTKKLSLYQALYCL